MRISQFTTVLITTLGLAQALVVPVTSPEDGVSKRSSGVIDSLEARAPVCRVGTRGCSTCPKVSIIRGRPASTPVKCDPRKQKCPTAAAPVKCDPRKQKCPTAPAVKCDPRKDRRCKREQNIAAADSQLSKRIEYVIQMDSAANILWGVGDSTKTDGLSACSVMAVWDQTRIIEAHIPPSQLRQGAQPGSQNPNDYLSTAEVIQLYLDWFNAQVRATPLGAGKGGVMLMSTTLSRTDKNTVKRWFTSQGITVDPDRYTIPPPPGGTLYINRGNSWPPTPFFSA